MSAGNRLRPLRAAALLVAAPLFACHQGPPANTPGAVADRFVDLYFVRVDQLAALPLTTAIGREKLRAEIRDVAAVRDGQSEAPEEAKQEVTWRRTELDSSTPSADDARAIYEITIRSRTGGEVMTRFTYLTLHREAGQWRVADYLFSDSAPPVGSTGR